jgi:hypothetical protein
MTDNLIDGSNRSMVHLLRHILSLYWLHEYRILACEETDKQRPTTSSISPSKFLHHLVVLAGTDVMQWLLNRQQRGMYDPSYQNPHVFYSQYPETGGQYGMNPMPPPMYDPNAPMPPSYQPPAGGSKVDPSQWRTEPTRRPAESGEPSPEYSAPSGPPPAHIEAHQTGASTASNNPYRL